MAEDHLVVGKIWNNIQQNIIMEHQHRHYHALEHKNAGVAQPTVADLQVGVTEVNTTQLLVASIVTREHIRTKTILMELLVLLVLIRAVVVLNFLIVLLQQIEHVDLVL